MGKSIKKILCTLLVVILCFTSIPLSEFIGFKLEAFAADLKVGDIIEFGSYPQTEVKDKTLIAELNELAPVWNDWRSFGYYSGTGKVGTMVQGDWMRYTDVTYNGTVYRGVKFTECRAYYTYQTAKYANAYSYQDNNGYDTNITYWFRFEPLKWRILNPDTGLVLSETIIDAQAFNNTMYFSGFLTYFSDVDNKNRANDYVTSSIREWLNDDFYNTAFSYGEKMLIKSTEIDNKGYYTSTGVTGCEWSDGEDTEDKIFLLSYNEVRDEKLGFNSNETVCDNARTAQGSDYAKCQGLFVNDKSSYNGNSYWLLRSSGGGNELRSCCGVDEKGASSSIYYNVEITSYGIRPAMTVIFEDDSEDSSFFREHVMCAQLQKDLIDTYSFHNNVVIKNRIFNSLFVWEIIGDLGEILSFNFNDLTINANYFELYLADIIFALNNEKAVGDVKWKVGAYYQKISTVLMNFLKNSEDLDSSLDSNFIEKVEKFFSGAEFELDEGTAKKLAGLYNKNKEGLSGVFEGLSSANTIIDLISKSTDVVSGVHNTYNAYIMAKAYYETNIEYFEVLQEAGERLCNDEEYKKYGEQFLKALEKAKEEHCGSFDAIFNAAWTAILEATEFTFDVIFKNFVKASVYPLIGKVLGLSSGEFNTLVLAYNTTFGLLDMAFKHSKSAEAYKMIYYITPIERELENVLILRRANLLFIEYESDFVALEYEYAHNMLKQTNIYLYDNALKFATIKKSQDDIEIATKYKDNWNLLCCHYSEYDKDDIRCHHLCHETGFAGFVWDILNCVSKILKSNKVCLCGIAHY